MAARDMPFAIGSDQLPGVSKLIEETGEVQQVLGKVLGFGSLGTHWDGSDLKRRLEDELADMAGAFAFAIEHMGLDLGYIDARASRKADTFRMWHERIQKGLDPVTGDPA